MTAQETWFALVRVAIEALHEADRCVANLDECIEEREHDPQATLVLEHLIQAQYLPPVDATRRTESYRAWLRYNDDEGWTWESPKSYRVGIPVRRQRRT